MFSNPKFWKYLALAAAGVYVVQVVRKNGGTLRGNPEGIALDGDRLVDKVMPWLGLHPQVEPYVRKTAKQVMNKVGAQPHMRTVK